MDSTVHEIVPEEKCDSDRKIPWKYAKVTQDVVNWLVFKDYPNTQKKRDEVFDCLTK